MSGGGLTPAISEDDLTAIGAAVLRETKLDLSHYRPDLVQSLVARRMVLRHCANAAEYVRQIRANAEEARALRLALHGGPGGFFQRPDTFEALRTVLSGSLSNDRRDDVTFRAWAPCCRTGEEAYSVAITLIEMLEPLASRGAIRVFGTDLEDASVETARAALYPESLLTEISGERLSRFFSRESEGRRVALQVRQSCVFARHDIATDPPFSKMDLIVFRNQLSLLTAAVQSRILERLHYSLKPSGVLVLGGSESPEAAAPWLTPAAGAPGIFLRRAREERSRLAAARTKRPAERAQHRTRKSRAPAGGHAGTSQPAEQLSRAVVLGGKMNATQHFQALLEEQARTIESLRTANEELVTANEELQVSNEELVATREELQAANQELATINEEIRERNTQLSRTSAELTALIRNLDGAVLTVDADLRIRHFTPRAARLFSLAETDTGRRITDLQPKLQIPELEKLLMEAAATLAVYEREALDADGEPYRITIRAYVDENHYVDGAILSAWPIAKTR